MQRLLVSRAASACFSPRLHRDAVVDNKRQSRTLTVITAKKGGNKNKAIAKGDLPSKTCEVCGLPFTWRKKWEAVWDDVKYCSDKCRMKRRQSSSISRDAEAP